ncbi:MAG: hypothetical protein ACI4VH_06685 [Clostridia bacterium]
MATYTQGCSQVGSFNYASNFTLYVVLNDRDGNSSTNRSYVDYNVYCQSSGSGSIRANHQLYFELNGQVIRNENVYVNVSSPNAYIGIASGTLEVEHDSNGSKGVWFNASINATGGYGVSAGRSDTFWLNQIPRYTTVWNSERGKTLNSIMVNWSTSDNVDWIRYSLNGGSWQNATGGSGNNRNGYYVISNLFPNTQYTVKTQCRRADSGLWSQSGQIVIRTKDIARITNVSNCDFGQDVNINFSNLENGTAKLTVKVGDTEICTREDLTSTYTLAFTKEELSSMIKHLKDETTEITYIVTTNNTYTATAKAIITLKANIFVKEDGQWIKAKLYKKNGKWKLTKLFYKVEGIWRNTK